MTGPVRSMVRLLAVVFACTLAFGLVASGTASAQSYPSVATLTTDQPTVDPCDTVTLTGTGYLPDTTVTITANGKVVGTAMTDDNGTFTFPYPVACDAAAGQIVFTATDPATDLSTSVQVLAQSTGNGSGSGNGNNSSASNGSTGVQSTDTGALPTTGSNTDLFVRIAVLLIAGGGLVLVATRRRDRTSV